MTEELKAALIKRVSTKDWMANTTKSLVQEKLLEVKANVGYPQHVCVLDRQITNDHILTMIRRLPILGMQPISLSTTRQSTSRTPTSETL